jgi:Fe2+ or Zn2+ uptake regulation protein
VLDALTGAARHLSVEELHRLASKRSPGIGIATVYRSVKCLCGCGKVLDVKLGDGAAVYEAASPLPHAHLVCSSCGSVAEADSPELEKLVAAIAAKTSFYPSAMELRGLCSDCSKKGKKK